MQITLSYGYVQTLGDVFYKHKIYYMSITDLYCSKTYAKNGRTSNDAADTAELREEHLLVIRTLRDCP
jgi:hypothetical protein